MMTLDQYIHLLNKLKEENREAGALVCIYSRDDEGNSFAPIIYEPSVMKYEDADVDGAPQFTPINAICVN